MSIRVRIALLTSVLMAALMIGVGAGVYLTLQRSLNSEIESRLTQVYASMEKPAYVAQPHGEPGFPVPPPELDSFNTPGVYVQFSTTDGGPVKGFPEGVRPRLTIPADVLAKNQRGDAALFTARLGVTPVRVLSQPVFTVGGQFGGSIQVAEQLTPTLHILGKLRLLMFAGALIGLVITAAGAFVLAGRSLRPLRRITTTADQIGHSADLSQRIDPPQTGDEVQQLADTFNDMLKRLEAAFAAERRFVSDASHELRTPLTALRGNAEILVRQIDAGWLDPADLKEGLTDIRDEAERMGRLVQHLLTLARADVGWRPELEPIHLDQVVADAARVATPLAGDHRFQVRIDGEVDITGNADQLKQLLLILLDNAFTYTPDGGAVDLTVARADGHAELVVRDDGPGIPAEQRERIFDRFYRGEAAREHGTTGAGLGLAIARWIVDCHNGTIRAESAPASGTAMIVRLPLLTTGAAPAGRRPAAKPAREPVTALGDD